MEFRIRFAIARGRNIIYYRKLDQQLRPRATYIHVLRDYRKYLINLVNDIPDEDKYYKSKEFFSQLIKIIDPKVKTEECSDTILRMEKLYNDEQYK